MHRKNMIPRIQAGHVVTALALLVLSVILVVSVFLFGQASAAAASNAGGWQAKSAAMLAHDATHLPKIRITPLMEAWSYTVFLTEGYGASMGINPSALPVHY